MKKLLLTVILCSLLKHGFAQFAGESPLDTSYTLKKYSSNYSMQPPAGPKWLASGLALAGMGGSLIYLTHTSSYKFGANFKTVNDADFWLQMDKSEHVYLSYTSARFLASLGKWAGFSPQKSVLLGSASSLVYLTTKEYLDGHLASPGTGWSWADMSANILGSTLFASQELVWQEHKIQFKFSALPHKYEADLNSRANILFGHSIPERILKDYNAQTYWLSFNLKSLGITATLPSWLNLAVGYSGSNLFGPQENIGFTNGQVTFDRTDLKRYRQWYISPDVDLTKIKTNSRVIKTLLFALNAIKIPLPTLENSNQKVKGHWLHF